MVDTFVGATTLLYGIRRNWFSAVANRNGAVCEEGVGNG
jgi:hypothetical protein